MRAFAFSLFPVSGAPAVGGLWVRRRVKVACPSGRSEQCPFPAGYSMFAVGIGALLFGYWSMMRWNRERR